MLALIAGTGDLPRLLMAAFPDALICRFGTDADPSELSVRLETLGSFLQELSDRGVREVCFAGAATRPAIDPSLIDAATRPLMERLKAALSAGDDGALRVILGVFEEHGFTIRAAQDLLPSLLLAEGVPTHVKPQDPHGADAGRAEKIVQAMGRVDIGQACIVHHGQALAVEALTGTDWMLETLYQHRLGSPSKGGTFYKAPKQAQDRRVDLPTIGPMTVSNVAKAGLDGLVIEADGVLVLNAHQTLAAADTAGLFLWVRRAGSVT